ncbi:unnamed protein product, partial [Tilletia controversa]
MSGQRGSAIDPSRYASFGLTHVRYDAADPFAQLLALITLAPIFLLCAYTSIILYRRELTFLNALLGQLGCEAINWGLKRLIRQPRPVGLAGVSEEGYGMPSSHAQFMGFFCGFFLWHFGRFHPGLRRPRTVVNTMRRAEHAVCVGLIVLLSAAVCYSRYYLLYHSPAQIIVGLSLGLAIGGVYYYLTEHLTRLPLRLPAALASPVNSRRGSPAGSPMVGSMGVGGKEGGKGFKDFSISGSGSSSSLGPAIQMSTSKRSAPTPSPTTPAATQGRVSERRRSSLEGLLTLHESVPIRQIVLDHPIAIAFRIRDSWTVWEDGGIETDYAHWRREWERRRPSSAFSVQRSAIRVVLKLASSTRPLASALLTRLATTRTPLRSLTTAAKLPQHTTTTAAAASHRLATTAAHLRSFATTTATAMPPVPKPEQRYDLVVVGGGSGAMGMSRRAASYGINVCVIEEDGRLGGTCVNVGCVPKKLMWHAADQAEALRSAPEYGFGDAVNPSKIPDFNWKYFAEKRDAYVRRLNGIYDRNLEKDKVTYISGHAQLTGPKSVRVTLRNEDGSFNTQSPVEITTDRIVIATGGRPVIPSDKDIPGASLGIDSDGFFALREQPKRVAVVGAGYIAVELAGVFNTLGSETHLLIRHDTFLRPFDSVIAETLQEYMDQTGLKVRKKTNITKVEGEKGGPLTIHTDNGEPFEVDCL